LGFLALGVLTVASVGCNTVPKRDFDTLQNRFNVLDATNKDLTAQLMIGKERESELLAGLAMARTRATAAEANLANSQAEIGRLQLRVTELSRSSGAPPRPPTGGTTITLPGDVLFASGKATLTAGGKLAVAQKAREIVRSYPRARIIVVGHTDSDPIRKSKWRDNDQLSLARATAVANELIAKGLAAGSVQTQGMGARAPVVSNATRAGKAKNRRVVIKVIE